MPYRSTSTPEYPPDGKSIGTYEQTVYEILKQIKIQDQNSKKIAQIFPQMCHAFCLRDFLLNMKFKNKKNTGLLWELKQWFCQWECQCYESVNCISVKELNQIKKLLYVKWAWKSSQHFVMPPKVFPLNDVWETSTELHYWWCVTTQVWVVLLIGQSKFPTNKKLYPDLVSAHLQCGISELFFLRLTGARVAQWWVHSPPTNVAGFESRRRRHMCVEFVVGSLLFSERFFSRYSGFPLSSKTNTCKF